jgi:hypothetical protein
MARAIMRLFVVDRPIDGRHWNAYTPEGNVSGASRVRQLWWVSSGSSALVSSM